MNIPYLYVFSSTSQVIHGNISIVLQKDPRTSDPVTGRVQLSSGLLDSIIKSNIRSILLRLYTKLTQVFTRYQH
jgi:hypothetical protein